MTCGSWAVDLFLVCAAVGVLCIAGGLLATLWRER